MCPQAGVCRKGAGGLGQVMAESKTLEDRVWSSWPRTSLCTRYGRRRGRPGRRHTRLETQAWAHSSKGQRCYSSSMGQKTFLTWESWSHGQKKCWTPWRATNGPCQSRAGGQTTAQGLLGTQRVQYWPRAQGLRVRGVRGVGPDLE